MIFFRSLTIRSVLLIAFSASRIFAGTVGDPANPSSLPGQIRDAYSSGARDITIRSGKYTVSGTGKSIFRFDEWKDVTLHAAGVSVVADHVAEGLGIFELRECTNVSIDGATLSQTEMTAYQGKVVATGTNAAGKSTCDWRPDAGYPVPPGDAKVFPFGPNVVDGATRSLKLYNGDYGNNPMRAAGDGSFRITFDQTKLKFGVGDWLVGRFGDANGKAAFKVHLIDCRNCTVKDVTMSRNGFAPIREEGGGGNHILHCRWTNGPRPDRATEDPLVTSAADGLHSTGANPGPDIEQCTMDGVFLDDCIAIHGGFQDVTAANGNTLTLGKGWGGLRVGQPARICTGKGFIEQANVTAIDNKPDRTVSVTLDRELSVPAGAKVNNPLTCGAGFKIIGCELGNTRSRGILVKADNGTIRDNVCDGCVMSAVSVGPEYYWNEAGYVENLTIDGNIFRNCGKRSGGDAAILVHGEGVAGNRHLVIAKNQFLSNYSRCISIKWANDVSISGNSMTAPADAAAGSIASPVGLAHCSDIRFDANRFAASKTFKSAEVELGPAVTGVSGLDRLIKSASTGPG